MLTLSRANVTRTCLQTMQLGFPRPENAVSDDSIFLLDLSLFHSSVVCHSPLSPLPGRQRRRLSVGVDLVAGVGDEGGHGNQQRKH